MPLLLSVLGVFAAFILILQFPRDIAVEIVKEGGFVESATALMWFLAAIFIVAYRQSRRGIALAFLPLFCGMRELDLHREWTTDSVLKLRYWTGDAAPFGEKIIAATILAVLATIMIYAIAAHYRHFRTEMKNYSPFAIAVISAVAYLALTKFFFNGFDRKFGEYLQVDGGEMLRILIGEEVMELAASLLVMYAVFCKFAASGAAK